MDTENYSPEVVSAFMPEQNQLTPNNYKFINPEIPEPPRKPYRNTLARRQRTMENTLAKQLFSNRKKENKTLENPKDWIGQNFLDSPKPMNLRYWEDNNRLIAIAFTYDYDRTTVRYGSSIYTKDENDYKFKNQRKKEIRHTAIKRYERSPVYFRLNVRENGYISPQEIYEQTRKALFKYGVKYDKDQNKKPTFSKKEQNKVFDATFSKKEQNKVFDNKKEQQSLHERINLLERAFYQLINYELKKA